MGRSGQLAATLLATILACAFALSGAAHATSGIPLARDLQKDGQSARAAQRVILVIFTTAGCPWCHRVREEYLKPMLANAQDASRVIVREIDIGARDALADFAGAATTHAAFAGRHEVRFAPTVFILGPGGELLAEPLVGFGTADYYGYYLDQRIDAGLAKLHR